MRISVQRDLATMLDELLRDQPAKVVDLQPRGIQLVDFQGKIPQVDAGILRVAIGLEEQRQADSQVVVDRRDPGPPPLVTRGEMFAGHFQLSGAFKRATESPFISRRMVLSPVPVAVILPWRFRWSI